MTLIVKCAQQLLHLKSMAIAVQRQRSAIKFNGQYRLWMFQFFARGSTAQSGRPKSQLTLQHSLEFRSRERYFLSLREALFLHSFILYHFFSLWLLSAFSSQSKNSPFIIWPISANLDTFLSRSTDDPKRKLNQFKYFNLSS